jgi:Trypsin-like peptidase domain
MRLALLCFALSVGAFGQTACSNANFQPGEMNETSLTSEFKGSVLRLQIPGSLDSGTGYLVDSINGYVITAFHVVASVKTGTTIDVTSPSRGLNGVKLTASLVKSLATLQADGTVKGVDLALLQLTNPALLSELRPVDISLRYPSVDQTLYAMGYPQLGDEPNTTFSEQLVKFMAAPSDGSIQVTQAIFGGNSGGPLLDPSGSVIGTCRESVGIGSAVARYVPMSDGEALLDLIPLSDRMKSLDQKIKEGSISESDLKDILVKNSKNPSNIELYAWARVLMANRDQYASASTRKLLQCPMRALMQRGMDDLVIELSQFADLETVGNANFAIAERMISRGQPLLAESHVQAAASSFTAMNDPVGTYRSAMLSTRIQLAIGSTSAAASQSSKVLTHINSLSEKDKATALSIAADIDIARGNSNAAIIKLNQASQYSVAAHRVTMAAGFMTASADLSLKLSKPLDAETALAKASTLYHSVNDVFGEAETVYKLVGVESVLGNSAASAQNLKNYLALDPHGVHSAEAKSLLADPQNLGTAPIIK